MNLYTLKGIVDCKATVGTGAGIGPSSMLPPGSYPLPQPCSCHHHSHTLRAPATITPARCGMIWPCASSGCEQSCCPRHPSGTGGGGEVLSGDQGWQPPLTYADGAEQLGPVLGAYKGCKDNSGTGYGCEWWLWHCQWCEQGCNWQRV